MFTAVYVMNAVRKSIGFATYAEAFDFLDDVLDRKRGITLAVIKHAGKVVTTLRA